MVVERSSKDGSGRARALSKRRQQAEATREQLITAAREMFESDGYQATTVGAITNRANTAHGTFYLYFSNKEDAFGQVIAEVVNELYVTSMEVPTDQSDVDPMVPIRGFLTVFAKHRNLWRCLLEAMLQSADVERMWVDLRRSFTDASAEALRALQDDGRMRSIDPVIAATALNSMVEWFAFTHLVFGEPENDSDALDRATAVLHDLWEHAVYGVLPPKQAGGDPPRA